VGGNAAGMGRGELHVRFWWEIFEGKRPLGNLGADGRIIFNCILNTQNGVVYWTNLVQDMNKWKAPMYTVINFRVP